MEQGKIIGFSEMTGFDQSAVMGILLALRYLAREAKNAGLNDVAITIGEAELTCDRYIEASPPSDIPTTQRDTKRDNR